MVSSNPDSPIDLSRGELALARQLTYDLLGRLYLEGVTAVTLPTIQIIPSLARTVPAPFNADEAAVSHQTLFGFNVFPYESIFLDDSGLLGGAVSTAVLCGYHDAGFEVDTSSTSPDHIGHELALLAHLCGAEADAWQDDMAVRAEHMRDFQWDFLQKHLLRWLVPFVSAVKGQERPFYSALAQLTLDFVHDHWQEISESFEPPPVATFLPAPPSLLDDEKTGLKEIAAYLTTPPYSGFYLSWDDVTRLARTHNVPRGFGDRTQMLTNLLRGAAQFDALPALLSQFKTMAAAWHDGYTAVASAMPTLAPFVANWRERTAQAGQILSQIQSQIETAA